MKCVWVGDRHCAQARRSRTGERTNASRHHSQGYSPPNTSFPPHLTLLLPRHPSVILPGISSSQQSVPFSFWFVYCHIAIARTLKLATPLVYFCLYIYTLIYSQVYEVFTRNINSITTFARILKAVHDCFMCHFIYYDCFVN